MRSRQLARLVAPGDGVTAATRVLRRVAVVRALNAAVTLLFAERWIDSNVPAKRLQVFFQPNLDCQLAACKILANSERMQSSDGPSVRYWSKEINGTLTGGLKKLFFNSRCGGGRGTGRPRRLNPVNPCPEGLPGVA